MVEGLKEGINGMEAFSQSPERPAKAGIVDDDDDGVWDDCLAAVSVPVQPSMTVSSPSQGTEGMGDLARQHEQAVATASLDVLHNHLANQHAKEVQSEPSFLHEGSGLTASDSWSDSSRCPTPKRRHRKHVSHSGHQSRKRRGKKKRHRRCRSSHHRRRLRSGSPRQRHKPPKRLRSRSPRCQSRSKSPIYRSRSRSPRGRPRYRSRSPRWRGRLWQYRTRSRSPRYRTRSRSPRHRSWSRSPRHRSWSRSPRHRSWSRSPRHRSWSRSPRHRSWSRSPRYGTRSVSPQYRAKSRSPRHRSRSRSARRKRKHKKKRRARSPGNHGNKHRRRRYRSKSPASRSRYRQRSSHRYQLSSDEYSSSPAQTKSGRLCCHDGPPTVTSTTQITDDSDQSPDSNKMSISTARRKLADLTALCQQISQQPEKANSPNDSAGVSAQAVRHPFQVAAAPVEPPGGTLFFVADNQMASQPNAFTVNEEAIVAQIKEKNILPKTLLQKFPVSTGTKHQKVEDSLPGAVVDVSGRAPIGRPKARPVLPSIDKSQVVLQQMQLQARLQANPNDILAAHGLAQLQAQLTILKSAEQAHQLMAGEEERLQPLSKADLEAGTAAWVTKNMFYNLAPVKEGFGVKMLRKFGWKEGDCLGKSGVGVSEPVPVPVKVDRKGLATEDEGPGRKTPAISSVNFFSLPPGKHPVSMLMEYCSRAKLPAPDYEVVMESGPGHSKRFKFKVTVNGTAYIPAMTCGNKKLAKAAAAEAAIKALGIGPTG